MTAKHLRQALADALEKQQQESVGGWPVELEEELGYLVDMAESELWLACSDIARWYHHQVPSIDLPSDLTYFAMQSDVLGQLVVGKTFKMRFDPAALTAFVSLSERLITIPGVYFMRELYELAGVDLSLHTLAAIGMVNGSQMHEALHLLYTKVELATAVAESSDPVKARELLDHNPHFGFLLQVAEDLYIEANSERDQQMHHVIVAKNHVLFPAHSAARAFTAAYAEDVTPAQLVNLMPMLKCKLWYQDPRWAPWEQARDLMWQARDTSLTPGQRVDLVMRLFEHLDQEATGGQGQQLDQGQLSAATDESKQQSQQLQAMAAELAGLVDELLSAAGIDLEQLAKELASQAAQAAAQPGTGQAASLVAQVEALSANLGKLASRQHKPQGKTDKGRGVDDDLDHAWEAGSHRFMADRVEGYIDLDKLPQAEVIYLEPLVNRSDKIRELPQLAGFAQELSYQRQVKRTPGQLLDRGSHLRDKELWRLAIDSRVMSYRDSERVQLGTPEVQLLGDISGSTNSTAFEGLEHGESLRDLILSALYTSFMQLRAARVNVGTWVHTTKEQPLVASIASHGMPVKPGGQAVYSTNVPGLFAAARNLPSNQNMDGVAIQCVLDRFTTRQGSKLLIMLCDGEPSGSSMYWGLAGRVHTTSVVNAARRKGIQVVVLSLVEDVVEANDSIYGREFNVPVYKGRLGGALRQALGQRLQL